MKKLKILIIDSNPIINIGFKSIFKNSVIFEVAAFSNNKNEINEIMNQQEIDLVISEINFKDGNVKDILKLFKKKDIDVPLVIFTSESNENKSVNLLKYGASGFLTKNLRKKTIKRIIQDVAITKYGSKELNKFTRLKNRFSFDYNKEKLNSLSKRELEVLKLFFRGKRNIEISEKLNINQKTVNTYITRIMKKLEVNSKTDLYLLARKHIKQPY